ncbi:hypothetical protein [Prevotella sp. RM4]|uniref:hypothetical protein n=1 Tax=Prevotella sp. RM4 TaxID=1200547 RepID=UPI0018DD1514|nr:hypothetical protein [Prevotella sp. RM4]
MRMMDEKHSSVSKSAPTSEKIEKSEPQISYAERQKKRQGNERKSCILLVVGAAGFVVLIYIFIRLYIVIGDYVFNSSIFGTIAIVGFIGAVLYMLFLFGVLIYGSIANAKSSGGISVLAVVVFFILLAAVFALMNSCT